MVESVKPKKKYPSRCVQVEATEPQDRSVVQQLESLQLGDVPRTAEDVKRLPADHPYFTGDAPDMNEKSHRRRRECTTCDDLSGEV
jgi:hypothetical protein